MASTAPPRPQQNQLVIEYKHNFSTYSYVDLETKIATKRKGRERERDRDTQQKPKTRKNRECHEYQPSFSTCAVLQSIDKTIVLYSIL